MQKDKSRNKKVDKFMVCSRKIQFLLLNSYSRGRFCWNLIAQNGRQWGVKFELTGIKWSKLKIEAQLFHVMLTDPGVSGEDLF